jgi:hypothetical protein
LDVTIDEFCGNVFQASPPAIAGRQAGIAAGKPYTAE